MNKRILIVDDDYAIVDVMKTALENQGYDVDIAFEGKNIERLVAQHCPNLILLDLKMSKPNGEVVARRLKTNSSTQNIPVLLVSGKEEVGTIATSVGVEGALKKPFDIEELQAHVKKYIYG